MPSVLRDAKLRCVTQVQKYEKGVNRISPARLAAIASLLEVSRRATGRPKPMKPLALSDDQLTAVMRASLPLSPDDRGAFLQQVAAALQGQPIGHGSVHRIVAQVKRKFFEAPTVFERRLPQVQPRTSFDRKWSGSHAALARSQCF